MSENITESESPDDVNMSRLREMAVRGNQYREELTFDYFGEELHLFVKPLTDKQFLPIAAFLEDRLDIDPEEAQEAIEEEKDPDGGIDPSNFDEEFVEIMQEAAVMGVDTEQGDAEGEDEEGLRETIAMLQGGSSLIIAEKVLEISSDAESAESFRRDGGSE
jgi:hypothetical protein